MKIISDTAPQSAKIPGRNFRLKIGLALFALGFLGVLSMLTMDMPAARLPPEVTEQFTPLQLKLLTLVNPTIMLLIAVLLGVNVYKQVNLSTPLLEKYLTGHNNNASITDILKSGAIAGIISGILTSGIALAFTYLLQEELKQLGEQLQPTPLVRFLYGGITEEILIRFGFMSFVIWVLYKIIKSLSSTIYYIGIFIAALLFAIAHLPVAFLVVENPSAGLISYILLGNSAGGIIFGWIYWKKGLEAAFLSHMFTHAVIMIVAYFMQ